jgi:dihydroorotate dehydrogenase electron transfer subunit
MSAELPIDQARYPDDAWQGTVVVEENVEVARDTRRIRFAAPQLARRIVPGQFVMMRLPGRNDPLLGRPLALYDVVDDASGRPQGLDIVYLVIGRMTSRLAQLVPDDELEVWGPLGNGFPPQPAEHLVMVAGGIGQTPMLALGREHLGRRHYGDPPRSVEPCRVSLCYGARSADYLAGVEDFEQAGITVRLATEDGSRGHHGRVTELIEPLVRESTGSCRIVCCGPERMMEATAAEARRLGVPCQVSLETPMACGIGICFSCVVKVRNEDGQGWDYRRTCVEGPVFDAEQVVFNDEELGAPDADGTASS